MTRKADHPLRRTRLTSANLVEAWKEHASEWVAWAQTPGHDSYWRFHRDLFIQLIPAAGMLTLDLGCGEGRLARELAARGHQVIGVDTSSTVLAAGREADPDLRYTLADAAVLPFRDASFDCVIAFMSLQDIDDLEGSVREAARVLDRGGRLCLAIVHPLNSAGEFDGDAGESPFVVRTSYLDRSYYADDLVRDGLQITFVSSHRPLQAYADALTDAGLLIERIREPALPEEAVSEDRHRRWQRLPLFLHMRALKP